MNSSLDFLWGFLAGIRSGICIRNSFGALLQESLQNVLQKFPPWNSSRNSSGDFLQIFLGLSDDLQKFLHGFTTGIPSGIFSRNSSRDFFKNSGDLLQKFFQEFHPGIYSKNSSEDFFRGLSIAISPAISTRNSFRKFSEDYLQKFLWIFSENVSGEFLQEFL